MRTNIAFLVTSWITGIVAGALGAPHRFVIPFLLLGCAYFLYRKVHIHLLVAGVLLVLLGYLYGTQPDNVKEIPCTPSDVTEATLLKTYSLTPTQARYVFVTNEGCELLVYASRFPVLVRGTEAALSGKQQRVSDAFSSLPEYAEFLRDEGISLVIQNAEVEVKKEGDASLDTFRIAVVDRISMLFREPDASLITAMIAGDQGMISRDIKDVYRKSGITHILSISGLHVSIIALILSAVVGIAHVSPAIRSGIISGLLWTYIVAVGSPASAVRAGFFWTCFVLAYRLRALVGLLTVILLTLATLVSISPALVRSIGFELSVMAVCGIGVALFWMRRVRLTPFVQAMATLLAVSVGATLATAPLTLYYFGNLSFVGLLTNMIVVPLLPFITYLVLLALFFQVFFIPLALVFSFIVHILMTWVLVVATLFASIPYGHMEELSFPLWGVAVYYTVVVAGIIFSMRYSKISWREWWI